MDDKTVCTFTNFVGNTELGGDVDRPEKEPPCRSNLAGWETGPTRFTQGLTKIHMKSASGLEESHTAVQAGISLNETHVCCKGWQCALAAMKANVS